MVVSLRHPNRRSYRWPPELARLVGRWEAERLRNLRRTVQRKRESAALEKIWAHFPRKKYPRELRVTDVEDYKKAQLRNGRSPQAVRLELAILYRWYRWLQREVGMEVDNPVILWKLDRKTRSGPERAPLLPPVDIAETQSPN